MAKQLIDDDLWALLEPLIPVKPRRYDHPGRKPLAPRAVLTGIVYVLRTGNPWEYLPQEMGCGSGMSCWRYLKAWQEAGMWQQIWEVLLAKLREANCLDLSRVPVDSSSIRAVGAGTKTGPNPTDRAKPGSKHHIATDAQGIPVAVEVTGANVNDITELLSLLDDIPSIKGKQGRPKHIPDAVYGDRGYDSEPHRQELERRGIEPYLAKRGTEHGSGLGKVRWVVERTISWLHDFKRLRVRFERTDEVHEGLLILGCALICWSVYVGPFC